MTEKVSGAGGAALSRPKSVWWTTAFLAVVTVSITASMTEKRGIAMGVLAAMVYGSLVVANWMPRRRLVRWSARHPVLDAFLFAPLAFLGLAFLTTLSLPACLGMAVLGALLLLAVSWLLRLRQGRAGA